MNLPYRSGDLEEAIEGSIRALVKHGMDVDTGHWQGVPTQGRPDLVTRELIDFSFACPSLPPGFYSEPQSVIEYWQRQVKPNLPWAEDHFHERVSGIPSNPGEEYMNWPWWNPVTATFTDAADFPARADPAHRDFKFTHTYQERFWPKWAGTDATDFHPADHLGGIRYKYGDLGDVVDLLIREPFTRQAYFPIFFPEDTGATHGGRIPCTLGYHFLLRDGRLHLWYTIRSCDAVRHFRDDVYLALRLLLWVMERLVMDASVDSPWMDARPGTFHFKAFSFHYHKGDEHHLRVSKSA